jgi:predicted AlkP superfamily pyrophosphatase or phosphodiesterase
MRRILLASLAALSLSACARARQTTDSFPVTQQGAARSAAAKPLRGRVTDHVVVISIDGLRPDAIQKFNAKTLQRLMREGRYSLNAKTISISNTLPSHTSMLTGVGAETHGITWNSDKTKDLGHVHVPTIFGVAREAGFTTAAFFSKTKFNALGKPGTLDHVEMQEGELGLPWSSDRAVANVRSYLKHNMPNLMFVHLAEADFAGHNFGWMGRMYGAAVRGSDAAVAKVLELADARFGPGGYTVIVTADHGGHGKRHGSTDPRDITIPWIVWGAGVQHGDTLSSVRTMDTAVTALWMLGLEAPGAEGKALTGAFDTSVASR